MKDNYQGLASAILAAVEKVNTIYLRCNNPVSQQSFDNNEFYPVQWDNPHIVAADSTVLAYYCPTNNRWMNTRAKASWINKQATPKHKLLEIKSSLIEFFVMIG